MFNLLKLLAISTVWILKCFTSLPKLYHSISKKRGIPVNLFRKNERLGLKVVKLKLDVNYFETCLDKTLILVLMSLKVFASNLSQLLFILKLATFLQPLELLYLQNVYYLKLSLIILIYYVTFTGLILEKGFMKVENVRI